MSDAPIDLADLKDDLGIDPADTSQDAWLQRRVDALWARIESYTDRKLRAPPAAFTDDWGRVVDNAANYSQPPTWSTWLQPSTVFLRYYPVASITGITIDGAAGSPADVHFDPKTGKLFNIRPGAAWAEDLSRCLVPSRVAIVYTAGWDAIPADLYEVVLGAMTMQWPARQNQAAGGVAGTPKLISVADVGQVDLEAGNLFIESAAAKGTSAGGGDPLLGPYASLLDLYVDHRSRIGWAMQPVTSAT